MKLDSVDRYSSWRPNSADARALAASRLQTVVSNTAPTAPQALNSGRELPILPVKQGDNVQSRPVLQSDKPKGTDPALNLFREFKPTTPPSTTATVDAFPTRKPATGKDATGVSPQDPLQKKSAADVATGLTPAKEADPADQKAAVAEALQGRQAAKASAETLRQRAAEEAKNQPPKEPISKMLLDLVHSVWAASGSVVDAAMQQPKPGSPAATDGAAGESAGTLLAKGELTYAPPTTALGSSTSK